MLSHTLSGEMDGCGLRQLLLLAGLVDMMPWNSPSEFTPFAAILYPSLQVSYLCFHIYILFISLLSLTPGRRDRPHQHELCIF